MVLVAPKGKVSEVNMARRKHHVPLLAQAIALLMAASSSAENVEVRFLPDGAIVILR